MTEGYSTIDVTPVTPAAGAEISGIDLSKNISDETCLEVHRALMAHGVVFFRDQAIAPQQHADFARRFGDLRMVTRSAFEVNQEVPEMHELINDEARPPNVNHYHSDGIFRKRPEMGSMLRAVEVPVAGGDTIFVGMQAAYDALSDSMKAYLADKVAAHDFMKLHGSPKKNRSWEGDGAERMERARLANPPVAHPIVREHPVSGRKSLFIAESFTTNILDVTESESKGILETLFRHCALPEFQCRFHWRPDSIAFWDNRSTMHYAVADYWPQKRLMQRVSIVSDRLGSGDAWPTQEAA